MNLFSKILLGVTAMLLMSCTASEQEPPFAVEDIAKAPDTTMVQMRGEFLPIIGHQPVVGEVAPDFTAVMSDLSELTLGSLKGKRVVLNIFPSIDTGVCARSVRAFNERAVQMENTIVLCISKDLPFAQARFCGAEGINKVWTLSMFRNTTFDLDYGVGIATGPFRGLLARAVVVIDAEGRVMYNELVADISQEPNYDAVMQALS